MIGKKIYEIRTKKGFSLSKLADRANISKSYLSNIERNINQNPSIQVLQKIAVVLETDPITLFITDQEHRQEEPSNSEWLNFVNEMKELDLKKDEIKEFKTIFDYMKWKKENNSS